MRRTLEIVGVGMLAVLYWITYSALNGPEKLPNRIPTHFDFSGQPNAWGPPGLLWFLPVSRLRGLLDDDGSRGYSIPSI